MSTDDNEPGLETPEADYFEQGTPVTNDPEDQATDPLAEASAEVEADEGDILEQALPVALNEEYPQGDST